MIRNYVSPTMYARELEIEKGGEIVEATPALGSAKIEHDWRKLFQSTHIFLSETDTYMERVREERQLVSGAGLDTLRV